MHVLSGMYLLMRVYVNEYVCVYVNEYVCVCVQWLTVVEWTGCFK